MMINIKHILFYLLTCKKRFTRRYRHIDRCFNIVCLINRHSLLFSASVSVLVCPIGLLVTGVLTDRLGKRIALQIALIPMTLGWLLLAFADSYRTILVARILLGFPLGKFLTYYFCILSTYQVT